jgi:membrane peptidoglycan carboxypeptidase
MAVDRGFGSNVPNHETRVNLATGGQSGFQAGSTFKLFTLAAAIAGHQPLSLTMNSPPTISVDGFTDCSGGVFPAYPVKNAEDAEGGTFSMVKATWESVNTYFVQLERRTGICAPWKLANTMGIRQINGKPLAQVPSLTLGSADVSPLAVASAYATMAARGKWCAPYAVTKVADVHGRQVSATSPSCRQVLDPGVAEQVTGVLRGVIDGPDPKRTGASASIGLPAAGKTGTTEGFAAAWFTGYTPQLAASVWVGDPRGGFAHPLKNVSVAGRTYPHVYGADLPAQVWKLTMSGALAGTPPTNFTGAGASVIPDQPGGGGGAPSGGPAAPPAPAPPKPPKGHKRH